MGTKRNKTLRLSEDVIAILDAQVNATAFVEEAVRAHHQGAVPLQRRATALVYRQDQPGSYVSELVMAAATRWRQAQRLLEEAGWEVAELRYACEALAGYRLPPGYPATQVVSALNRSARSTALYEQVLKDAGHVEPRLTGDEAPKREVAGPEELARWTSLVQVNLPQSPPLCRALLDLAEEYWAGNTELASLLA